MFGRGQLDACVLGTQVASPTALCRKLRLKLCRQAAEARPQEQAAGLLITTNARGFLIRKRVRSLEATVLVIQKVWRGYLGRQRFALFLRHHNAGLRKVRFGWSCCLPHTVTVYRR